MSAPPHLNLAERLPPALWQLLQIIAQLAQERGWQLYLVGGAVRDALLAPASAPLRLADLDLVVDGFDRSTDQQAGVELATALHQLYPDAQLSIHEQFQTAALRWHQDPILNSLEMDIATARTEFYPYPAANPEVTASSIQQDLYRRDFTINALALCLTQPQSGEILDLYGGWPDLQTKQLRTLHADSFIEDPTRIYRGVRFAMRLGMTFAPSTIADMKKTIASGVYAQTLRQHLKAPALQTRLKAELKYILQADYWLLAIEYLNELGAWHCLHPQLHLDPETFYRCQLLDTMLPNAHLPATWSRWLLRLETLLMSLSSDDREQVIQQLQLPTDSHYRLATIDRSQQELSEILEQQLSVGQLVGLLQPYSPEVLLLVATTRSAAQREILQQYLSTWRQIKAPLNGHDLKMLGYKPGAQYKKILDAILVAALDGLITDRQQAIEFIQRHYPLTKSS